jgi:hypothetical protein
MASPSEQIETNSESIHLGKRNGLIDALRFFASAGIVVFHAGAPGASIGYAALPLFVLLFVHYASSNNRRSFYFLRLWIFWSFLYGLLKVAEIFLLGRSWNQEFLPSMILTGPSIHLWFLPFASIVVLLVGPARKVATAPVVIATSLIAFYIISRFATPVPLAQWLFVLPSFAFGLVLSRSWTFAAAACVVAWAWFMGWTSGVLQFAIAISVTSATMVLYRPATWLTMWMRDASLGVYLVHPFFLSILSRLGVADPFALAVTGILASAFFVAILKPRLPALF